MSSPLPPAPQTPRPARRRRTGAVLTWIAVVVVIAAGGGWYWKHQRDAAAAANAVPGAVPGPGMSQGPGGIGGPGARRFAGGQAQPVSVAAVRRQDMRVLLQAIGTVTAQNTAIVRTKVDGELQAIFFREGDMVKAGTLLAQIDPRSYQAALTQAAGGLARDQATLKNAQVDLQRYQDLLAKDSVAKQTLDTQVALVRQLEGTVQVDQGAVDVAKLNLSYTKVTAPISGRLGLKQADLGNVIHAADTTGIVTITQTQPIYGLFAIPEASLAKVAASLRSGESMPVEAWDRDRRNKLATGKVSFIDNLIDTTTGTIKLKAVFPNQDSALFPNQFINVVLQTDTLHDTLAVPSASVQRGTPGTYVYGVSDDGTVAVRKVTLGPVEGDWTSVTGDVHPGEKVVTDGADRLRDGAKVQVIAPTAAAAADAQVAAGRSRAGGMDRLPPDVRDKLRAMSPEDRRAFMQKYRQEHGGAAGAAGAPATTPANTAPNAPATSTPTTPAPAPAPAR